MNRFKLVLLICLTATSASTASAQPVKFTSPATYPAGAPYVITSGDFNGDGKMDLVAGDVQNNDVVMLLGDGAGAFSAPMKYHQTAAPYYLATGDFNRDGKLDLVTTNPNAATISMFAGKGDGSFVDAVNYSIGRYPTNVRAADFNRDGWPDLALLDGNNNVAVLINNKNGTFQNPVSYALVHLTGTLTVADVNGDGNADLIPQLRSEKKVMVLRGKGDGTFHPPLSSSSASSDPGTGPYSIITGDFDRDGKLDLALVDELLKIMKGNGDGTFGAPSFSFRFRNTAPDVKIGDLNGDGKLDLVASGVFSAQALQIMLGVGDGTFQDAGDQVQGSSSISVVVADLNGDTRVDLAANVNSQLTVALVNVTPGNLDDTSYFVHQQYVDFLAREPDADGFNFWSNEIAGCAGNQPCIEVKRVNVSAAFYLSIEHQETAFLVERLYKAAYGDATGSSTNGGPHQLTVPIVRWHELSVDAQQIAEGVIVRETGWPAVLENNKQNFVKQFVQRARFAAAFPTSMTPAEFVDKLDQNGGRVLSPAEIATAVALFGGANNTANTTARAEALRQVAEDRDLYQAELNRAFVLMQYFGYFRRNPNEGRDSDYSGYEFWLNKLNSFNGNFVEAEMVKAFITSTEYRNRFTQ
ncbi:MAG TPA: FG-GAP-like repeat-containing protein [Pyrinomonadaceae bacterium]|nr:FG-GAP-like repeat-containing protein [Pyrinomonadaceae bacterium]